MANSRFQYVRAYERADDRRLLPGCYAVVRLDGRGFTRFSRRHGFAKPNDARALRLMDAAAAEVMRAFPEVALAYGQSDEYSFLLRRGAAVPLFDRRPTKLATLFASTFAAAYCRFWPRFFGGGEGVLSSASLSSSVAGAVAAASADPFAPRARRRARAVGGPPPPPPPFGRGAEGEGEGEEEGGDDDDDEEEEDAGVPLVSLEPGAFEDEERDAAEGLRAIEASRAERAGEESAGVAADGAAAGPSTAAPPKPTPLRSTPAFDARCVEYPTARTVRDYFAWRQADAHINNQYNTAFWALVQRGGGLPPAEAQRALKGTGAGEKNELMFARGINYNDLPQRYRKGSVICWEEYDGDGDEREEQKEQGGGAVGGGREEAGARAAAAAAAGAGGARRRCRLALRHCDIIRDAFWDARPEILDEEGDAGDGSGRGGGRRPRE